jgi:hypothetical protein
MAAASYAAAVGDVEPRATTSPRGTGIARSAPASPWGDRIAAGHRHRRKATASRRATFR